MSLILLKVSPVVMSISEEDYLASLDLWRPEMTDDRLAVVMFTSTSDNILIFHAETLLLKHERNK